MVDNIMSKYKKILQRNAKAKNDWLNRYQEATITEVKGCLTGATLNQRLHTNTNKCR